MYNINNDLELVKQDMDKKIETLTTEVDEINRVSRQETKKKLYRIQVLKHDYDKIKKFFSSDAKEPEDIRRLHTPSLSMLTSMDISFLLNPMYATYYIDLVRDVYYSLVQLYGYQDKLISTDCCYLDGTFNNSDKDTSYLYLDYYWLSGKKEYLLDYLEQSVSLYLQNDGTKKMPFYIINEENSDKIYKKIFNLPINWHFYNRQKTEYRLLDGKLYNENKYIREPLMYDGEVDFDSISFSQATDILSIHQFENPEFDFMRSFLYSMLLYRRNNDIKEPLNRIQMEEFFKAMYGHELTKDPSRIDKRKVKIYTGELNI